MRTLDPWRPVWFPQGENACGTALSGRRRAKNGVLTMRYGRRRGPPLRLIGIISGVVLVGLVGALFWYSGQADKHAPPQEEIRVEATNVGVQ